MLKFWELQVYMPLKYSLILLTNIYQILVIGSCRGGYNNKSNMVSVLSLTNPRLPELLQMEIAQLLWIALQTRDVHEASVGPINQLQSLYWCIPIPKDIVQGFHKFMKLNKSYSSMTYKYLWTFNGLLIVYAGQQKEQELGDQTEPYVHYNTMWPLTGDIAASC